MTWLATHLVVVVGVAITLLVAILVLQQRRTPQSTVAWLLFVLLAPYLAIPVFLVLGFRKTGPRFSSVRFTPGDAVPDKVSELDAFFRCCNLPGASTGNAVRLLSDGAACWDAVQRLVASAERSLDITFYQIVDDPVGQAFVDALVHRAKAGVRVRLIIDRFGGFWRPSAQLVRLRKAGGQLRDFSPLLKIPDRGHLNLRNHRKMIIADDCRVFAGGHNVGCAYMGPADGSDRWADLSVLLEGPVAGTYGDVFRSDWRTAGGDSGRMAAQGPISAAGPAIAQLVPSGPDMAVDPMHDGLVNAIHRAATRVWLATPYFLPTEYLAQALTTAARRGVDVRIVVPSRSNQRLADLARGAYLRNLQKAGCRIMQYQPSMMHAKAGIIDGAAWIGSANFDVRSMLLNFESALFLYDPGSVRAVAAWFADLTEQCQTGYADARLPRRIAEGVFRLGSPML